MPNMISSSKQPYLKVMKVIPIYSLFFILTGCYAIRTPEPLTKAQEAKLNSGVYRHISIGLEKPELDFSCDCKDNSCLGCYHRYKSKWSMADNFLTNLRDTELFKEVDYIDKLSSAPDLICYPMSDPYYDPYFGEASPWSILTLGIVPVVGEYSTSQVFGMKLPNINDKIIIDHKETGTQMFGLISYCFLPSSKWKKSYPEAEQSQQLSYFLVKKQKEIFELLERHP